MSSRKPGITDIGNLKNLKSLASLNIKDTEIQSILPLLEMKTLNFIVLDKSIVKDWEMLEAYVTDSLTAEF